MQAERPTTLIDPVCGMTVDVAAAEVKGLLVEHDGRTWGFCSTGCRRSFVDSPAQYEVRAELAEADGDGREPQSPTATTGAVAGAEADAPVIDAGIRRWYASCPCCLSEAYPELKAQLDVEHAAEAGAHAH